MPNCYIFKRPVPIITVFALIVTGLLTSCGDHENIKHSSDSSKKTAALKGSEEVISLYKSNCMQCHGNEMQGMMGEKSNLQKVGSRLTKDEIANTIQNGGKLMPAQGERLRKMEIDKLADWLASKK